MKIQGQTLLNLGIFLMTVVTINQADRELGEAKEHYEMVKQKAKLPRYGACWTKAIGTLHWGCGALNEEVQGRLALTFMDCFLQQSGQETISCPPDEEISECLATAGSKEFQVYTSWYIQTQSLCKFLYNQLWHEITQKAVTDLTTTSTEVAEKLFDTVKLQDDVLMNQKLSLTLQQKLLEHGMDLNYTLEHTRDITKKLYYEAYKRGQEQDQMTMTLLGRVTNLYNLIVIEASWVYTIIYYVGLLSIALLMTTPTRTKEARCNLILIIVSNLVMERFMITWYHPHTRNESSQNYDEEYITTEEVYNQVWRLRQACLMIAVMTYIYRVVTYVDWTERNHIILSNLQRQNAANLQTILEGLEGLKTPTQKVIAIRDNDSDRESISSYESMGTDTTWRNSSETIDGSTTEDEEIWDWSELAIPDQVKDLGLRRGYNLRKTNPVPQQLPEKWKEEATAQFGHTIIRRAKESQRLRKIMMKNLIENSRLCQLHKCNFCRQCLR